MLALIANDPNLISSTTLEHLTTTKRNSLSKNKDHPPFDPYINKNKMAQIREVAEAAIMYPLHSEKLGSVFVTTHRNKQNQAQLNIHWSYFFS